MFLHDNGVILHYDDATLRDLYFIDPQWLSDVLAHVVTIREINPFARNGLMKIEDLQHIFKSSSAIAKNQYRYCNKFEAKLILCSLFWQMTIQHLKICLSIILFAFLCFSYIVTLLNKFEVALSWDSRTLLIPSLLPDIEKSQNEVVIKVTKSLFIASCPIKIPRVFVMYRHRILGT